jgi:GH18 family chitinase
MSRHTTRQLFTALIIFAVIASVFATSLISTPTAKAATFKIIGYLPSWAGTVQEMQLSKLTHVNYAFILPNGDGSLQGLDNPAKLQSLVSAAHAQGVKVLISVGGWNDGNDQGFETLAANATSRTNFTNNLVNLVNQYSLDGVDIDWEYPDPDNSNPDNPQPGSSAHNYGLMMTSLSSAMHSRGKLLTGAIVALGWAGKGIPVSVFSQVDFYNLMAYDGGDGALHSPYQFAVDSVNYWRGRGLPAEKTVLGVPFYGRPSWASYRTLIAAGCSPDSDTCNYQGNTVYYNGRPTIRAKVDLAKAQGGGIMYWENSQDTTDGTSLVSAIYARVTGGTAPTNTPIGPTATRTNTPVPTTGSGCTAPAYNNATAYVGGNRVTYNGRTWEAKWWTQGEVPSTGGTGVWRDLGACSGSATATNMPATPTFKPPTNTPVGPTATKTSTPSGAAAWQANKAYAVGALVTYGGKTYRCLQAHTSQVGWEPSNVPALWAVQ